VSFPILDAVRDVLVANPKITIQVQGHTDNVGQGPYNLTLSQQRADSVRTYLVAHGIDGSRLVSKGFGMNQPLVDSVTVPDVIWACEQLATIPDGHWQAAFKAGWYPQEHADRYIKKIKEKIAQGLALKATATR